MTIRVLIVEGSMDDAVRLQEVLLASNSYATAHVENLEECLLQARREQFDILLLTLEKQQNQEGTTVLARVRQELPELPIIALTAHDNEEQALGAVQAGAQDTLVKHRLDQNSLQRAIRYAIERASAFKALRKSEERYALAVAGARDGLWDWDLDADRIYLSPRWKAMLGFRDDEIGDNPKEWLGRIHPDDLPQLLLDLDTHRSGETTHFENEYRILSFDGSYRWMHARGVIVRDQAGIAHRIAGSQTDVTERHQDNEKLQNDALHDTLTGLPNRMHFMRLISRAIENSGKHKDHQFAILFIDIDRYKMINDSLGHDIGDKLLVAFTRRIEECLRPGDMIARIGGDEFTVFLDNVTDICEATHVADRIQKHMVTPFNLEDHDIFIAASIGITLSSSGYKRAEDMLRDADIAMYQAKAKGGADYEIFDQHMRARAIAKLTLETELRRAIEQHALIVYYQPIISLSSGQISGFEALARWQCQGNFISPRRFIPAAEETGLIKSIGTHVLESACQQLKHWQRAGMAGANLTMSVNLSSKQFSQANLVESIQSILEKTGLEGRNIRLEITESAIMENTNTVVQSLHKLKDLGIELSMDDFGTGYASLNSLHRLPIDTLKVDRSFISGGMHRKEDSIELVRTIITMAHNLGMDVVAEGVESEDLLPHLQQLQCEYAQGYYFSPAIEANLAEQMLSGSTHWNWTVH